MESCSTRNTIKIQTILTIFFVGILRTLLIIKTRKIAYSWAIHLSFNIIFFSGYYINNTAEQFASEPEQFNIAFGNLTMVLITGLLSLTSLIWLNNHAFMHFKNIIFLKDEHSKCLKKQHAELDLF